MSDICHPVLLSWWYGFGGVHWLFISTCYLFIF